MSQLSLMPLPSSCAPSRALFVVLWVIGSSLGFGRIQTTNRTLENLKREFTDPLTTLPQVFLKDAFSPVNYGTNVQTNQVVARAIIPRIPPNTLLPFVQLVRPTFSLVTVPTPRAALVPTSATSNCLIWQYRLGHRRKRVSGSDWDRHSCSRPRPPSSPVKARGRRVRRVLQFIPVFGGC